MNVSLLSAVIAAGIGTSVISANPRRLANQAFGLTAFVATAWLLVVFSSTFADDKHWWMRCNAAVAGLGPWALWLLKESIMRAESSRGEILRRSIGWFSLSILLGALTLHERFIESGIDGRLVRGNIYILHSIGLGAGFLAVAAKAASDSVRQSGIKRIEAQFFALNIGLGAFICVALMSLGNLLDSGPLKRAGLFVIGGSYALTGWAIAFHRIFDVKQVLLSILQPTALVSILSVLFLLLDHTIGSRLAYTYKSVVCVSVTCLAGLWLDRSSRAWLGLDGKKALSRLRLNVIAAASSSSSTESLEDQFQRLICKDFRATFSVFLHETQESYCSAHLDIKKDSKSHAALLKFGWATPEALMRRAASVENEALRSLMLQHSLGLIVAIPIESRTPAALLAVGSRANGWPFTYPEIARLQNVAELMDNILNQSRLVQQAALQAKLEHLAMMSRGLAHDLKNLITPISSYLVASVNRTQPIRPHDDVYVAAACSVSVMNDYVREALFFAENMQLKIETTKLEPIFATIVQLTRLRADAARVTVLTSVTPTESFLADGVLIQRMVTNLVTNAIDASPPGGTIKVSSAPLGETWIRLQVSDEGSGIPSEHLERIFDPYFTTKDQGETLRGFGLGLTITQKIVNLHSGKIDVQSHSGRGTVVTIDLPLSQPLNTPNSRVLTSTT